MNTSFSRKRIACDFILIVITAACTSLGAYFVCKYQLSKQQDFWVQQQKIIGQSKLHDSKLAYLERIERLESDYRSTSMIYFFTDINVRNGASVPGYDSKHAAFHALESEMHSCLLIMPFFFENDVGQAVVNLNDYFRIYPWESLIQNSEFFTKATTADRQHSSGDAVTKLIVREIRMDEYDRLINVLITAMADEIAKDLRTK